MFQALCISCNPVKNLVKEWHRHYTTRTKIGENMSTVIWLKKEANPTPKP